MKALLNEVVDPAKIFSECEILVTTRHKSAGWSDAHGRLANRADLKSVTNLMVIILIAVRSSKCVEKLVGCIITDRKWIGSVKAARTKPTSFAQRWQ